MITESTIVGGGGSFNVVNDFLNLGVDERGDSSIPIVNNVGFEISGLDTWLLVAQHPSGAASGRLIISNETPSSLSPGGFGGFTRMGCGITIPVSTVAGVITPWEVRFTTGVLTATGIYTISYSIARVPA